MPAESSEEHLIQVLAENARLREELEAAKGEADKLQGDLDHALTLAQDAKTELHDFVYAASHDLKEPLRAISSYTQLLVKHCASEEGTEEYVAFINEAVGAITRLVEQLLRLSRAGSSPRLSSVNLSAVVQTALFKLNPAIKASGAVVQQRDLPEAFADEAQLTQVFEILLDNALKYGKGSPPLLEVWGEEGDSGHVISVRDNGPGIEPKFHSQVFQAFKRLHGKEIAGSGLGLAVARKIIDAHQGKIWVESDGTGRGSTFRFLLPF